MSQMIPSARASSSEFALFLAHINTVNTGLGARLDSATVTVLAPHTHIRSTETRTGVKHCVYGYEYDMI